ncbi:MAG: UDP-N-acetylmuramate dehydrogenase [Vicinamibacterales bacterium]
MTRPEFDSRGAALLGARWRSGAELARCTTFRVGGPAEWLADVRTQAELHATLSMAFEARIPVTLLGGGSNVLVSDAGVAGLVIRLQLAALSQPSGEVVRAEAGVTINGLVRWMIGRGLAGLEGWAGTPGTVGGAICGNAHWKGENIGDRVRRVLVASRSGDLVEVAAEEMGFAYDTSRLQQSGEALVWADFVVSAGLPDTLRERARESLRYRKQTQPLAVPSAGCVFRNPDPGDPALPGDVPASAGALIDRAGVKGRRVGGARISDTHANFIVNEGAATAADIRALVEIARAAVRDRFGVVLRDEIVLLGTF